MTNTISLPSIHEIFPEHLLRTLPEVRRTSSTLIHHSGYPRPHVKYSQYSLGVLGPNFSFGSHRDIPSAACSSYHPRFFPKSQHQSTPTSSEEGEDVVGDRDRKHVCTVCNKRFNRPSSLRIHVNTHTGATPFRCPFPGCSREFNVNSNMRRHYRNHAYLRRSSLVPASSSSPSHMYPSSIPHSSLSYHEHEVNVCEYVWCPQLSSIMSFDDDEHPAHKFQPSLESHHHRGYEKSHKAIHFDRHRVSDVRTTRDKDHLAVAGSAVYSSL